MRGEGSLSVYPFGGEGCGLSRLALGGPGVVTIFGKGFLRDLLRSFSIERPRRPQVHPSWDLDVVLRHLMSLAFEPLGSASLRTLTKKTLFLVSLAIAKRVGELQALSKKVAAMGDDLVVSYLPHFIAKTERTDAPVPRSFRILSLPEFAGDLEEGSLLCPVRALNLYLWRTQSFVVRAHTLFVSPPSPLRSISRNAVLYFLREVISEVGAVRADVAAPLRAHSVRGVLTSVAFLRNWSISKVLEAATWRSNSVFASFYFKDIMCLKGYGPLVRLSWRAMSLIPRKNWAGGGGGGGWHNFFFFFFFPGNFNFGGGLFIRGFC